MEDRFKQTVYAPNTLEFVAVAVQYCIYMESLGDKDYADLTDKMTKLLPLLYLKATMLPDVDEPEFDDIQDVAVSEDDYNTVLFSLKDLMAENDIFLEVFVDEMKYSDTPISESVAECLTDIYQDMKNFTAVYEYGIAENMNVALYECIQSFRTYWGQRLVNVLRALHTLKYAQPEQADEEEMQNMDEDLLKW